MKEQTINKQNDINGMYEQCMDIHIYRLLYMYVSSVLLFPYSYKTSHQLS